MINSERVSNNSSSNPRTTLSRKKYITIKDQFTGEEVLRMAVHECMSICTLKQKLQSKIGGAIGQIRLRYKQQILSNNNASIADCNIKNESTIYYAPITPMDNIGMIYPYDFDPKTNKIMAQTLADIKKGFLSKIIPKLTEEGISGSYFLENVNRHSIAIFKPLDEEPYAPNNPKGYVGTMGQKGIRNGIRSGEQGYREVVAYALDPHQFHGVPSTIFVEFYHPSFKNISPIPIEGNAMRRSAFLDGDPSQVIVQMLQKEQNIDYIKRGSLQVFVRHAEECGNYGNCLFSVNEVHKIGILDIRILNCDRNDQNILVKKKKKNCKNNQQGICKLSKSSEPHFEEFDFHLIPIDHGLSLPDTLEICREDLTWMWWDQAEQPFSQKSLEYIENINIQKDVEMLQSRFNLREECVLNFKIANITLQKCAKAGLTLKEIGCILFRPDPDVESTVEKIIKEACHYLAACLQSGNSEILKNKIKKDILKKIKQKHQTDMPVILEEGCILTNLPQTSSCSSSENEEETQLIVNSELTANENNNPILTKQNEPSLLTDSLNNYLLKDLSSVSTDLPTPQAKGEMGGFTFEETVTSTPLKRSFSLPDLQSIPIQTDSIQEKNDKSRDLIKSQQPDKQEAMLINGNNNIPNNNEEVEEQKDESHSKYDQNHKHNVHSRLNGQNINSQLLHRMKTTAFDSTIPHKKVGNDAFFYCFETILERHIIQIQGDRLVPSRNRARYRFSSEELQKAKN